MRAKKYVPLEKRAIYRDMDRPSEKLSAIWEQQFADPHLSHWAVYCAAYTILSATLIWTLAAKAGAPWYVTAIVSGVLLWTAMLWRGWGHAVATLWEKRMSLVAHGACPGCFRPVEKTRTVCWDVRSVSDGVEARAVDVCERCWRERELNS